MSGLTPDPAKCTWCGMFHEGVCPKARRIEYYPDGTIKSVEFWPVTDTAGIAPPRFDFNPFTAAP